LGRFTVRDPRFDLGTDEFEVKPEETPGLEEALGHMPHPDAHPAHPAPHPVTDAMAHMEPWASGMDLPGADA
jgi:hypothetical protein